MKKEFSGEEKVKAVKSYEQGRSVSEIAEELGTRQSVILVWINFN